MKRKSLIEQVPLALFMGLFVGGATAFFFIQMPMVLIEQGVIASGLPTVIAAAGPPLGGTARALVAGSAAVGAGGFTWLAITLAGLISRPRKPRPERVAEVAEPAFILEKASARRPIFAHADLGEPLATEPTSVEPPLILPSIVQEEEEVLLAEWAEVVETETAIEAELEDVLELVDVLDEAEDVAPLAKGATITQLMARLEAGAERRAARQITPSPASGEFEGALRNALNELQRMAAR